MNKKVAVLIKDEGRQHEGLRATLGLLLEQFLVSMFVLGHEVETSETYQDNLEFLDEMEGFRYSDIPANVEKHGFQPTTMVEVAGKLSECDLIIPF